MTMATRDLVAFRLTGKRPDHVEEQSRNGDLSAAAGAHFLPALFAGYHDLAALRYDFPIVLTENPGDQTAIISLKDIFNELINKIAPSGVETEFERQQLLELENRIRVLCAQGGKGYLSKLWKKASATQIREADGSLKKDLKALFARLQEDDIVDGELVGCDLRLSSRLFEHLWTIETRRKSERFQSRIGSLILRLEHILASDFQVSGAAQEPGTLERSMGDAFASSFDFKALSDLLKGSDTHESMPSDRKQRIETILQVLKSQAFFPTCYLATDDRAKSDSDKTTHKFVFNSCAKAHDAFLDRVPEMVELVKAMAIGELEIENKFSHEDHSSYFLQFDQHDLSPDDLGIFPSYLALCTDQRRNITEKGRMIDVLASALPIKILMQTNDILAPASIGAEPFMRDLSCSQLAGLAAGLGQAFVMQSSASNLYRLRDELDSGMCFSGPALFSVYSGTVSANDNPGDEPGPYLRSAAAMEARVFPAFAFDPSKGPDLATRFSLLNNPAPQSAWVAHEIATEDDAIQRSTLALTFSMADFMAMDSRYSQHFVRITRENWVDEMVPVDEFVGMPADARENKIPYVLLVNDDGDASRFAVDEVVAHTTERTAEAWKGLQELGGINNSHALALLEAERAKWEETKELELDALRNEIAEAAAQAPTPTTDEVPPSPSTDQESGVHADEEGASSTQEAPMPEPAVASDDPWIETPRCTTCNECTDLNNQIFAYNDDMQAYVANPDGGPFKDIVEAAENCQVAIIHPGKPRDDSEPNLQELIARAEPFM